MAIQRAEFEINTKVIGNADGAKNVADELDNLAAKAGHAAASEKEMGEAAEKTGMSHAKMHAILSLLPSDLGKVGELAHLAFSPWLLAIGGITLAYEELKKKSEEYFARMKELVEDSAAMHERFRQAQGAADKDAADRLNEYNIHLAHLHDALDAATQAMERQAKVESEMSAGKTTLAAAQLSYYEALLKTKELQGKITQTDAADQSDALKLKADRAKEDAANDEQELEANRKRRRAAGAEGEAADQGTVIAGLDSVLDNLDRASEAAKAAQDTAKSALDKAAATATDADTKVKSFGDPSKLSLYEEDKYTKAVADRDAANSIRDKDQNAYDAATGGVDRLERQKKSAEADLDSAQKLQEARNDLARKLKDEAAAIEDSIDAHKEATARTRAAEDDAARQNTLNRDIERLNDLRQHGTKNAGESGELADLTARIHAATESGPGLNSDLANTLRQFSTAMKDPQHHLSEVHSILQQLTGFLLNHNIENENTLRNLRRSVDAILSRMDNGRGDPYH